MIDVLPLEKFMYTLQVEKTWRACYDDEKHTVRSFDDADDFIVSVAVIKDQLIKEYANLEVSGEDVKN
jgi:hypothetical protein